MNSMHVAAVRPEPKPRCAGIDAKTRGGSGWPRLLTTAVLLAATAALLSGCASAPKVRPSAEQLESAPAPRAVVRRAEIRRSAERDAWARLSRQFAMPMPSDRAARARVQRKIEFYVDNAHIVSASLLRAEPWVEYLLDELERRGLPGELFLVPLIESGFSARATSPSGAAGIWQFMPATGSHFGLRQTPAFDGRRDVFASTEAALEYLELLHGRFGDWALALAAFNHGQGNVARAMEANQARGRPSDYWSLQLSEDAMAYVPRILALRQLIETRAIPLPRHRPENSAVAIPVDVPLDLARVAALASVPLDELRSLNPATRSTVLPPSPGAKLALPRSALPALLQHDPQGRAAARSPLDAARRTLIASAAAPAQASGIQLAAATTSGLGVAPRVHVVQPGETLWSIAVRHGVDLGELGEANALPRGAKLSPGQRLHLPASRNGEREAIIHRIQPGDTLNAISRRYGVSLDALREANHIPGDLLRVGETLLIPRLR